VGRTDAAGKRVNHPWHRVHSALYIRNRLLDTSDQTRHNPATVGLQHDKVLRLRALVVLDEAANAAEEVTEVRHLGLKAINQTIDNILADVVQPSTRAFEEASDLTWDGLTELDHGIIGLHQPIPKRLRRCSDCTA